MLEKATLIKDIRCGEEEPIRAHLEILNDFVPANLDAEFGIHNFVSLHNGWQKRLATFALNDRFYGEVANWYFWAKKLIANGEIIPPRHVDTDPERSLFLIRLLTRLIFCWFLLEKRLLPPSLFREKDLRKLLADLGPASPTFYRAILQNLFFGTLNQPAEERGFRKRSASGGRDPRLIAEHESSAELLKPLRRRAASARTTTEHLIADTRSISSPLRKVPSRSGLPTGNRQCSRREDLEEVCPHHKHAGRRIRTARHRTRCEH